MVRMTAETSRLRPTFCQQESRDFALSSTWRVVDGRWMHARIATPVDMALPALVLVHGVGVSSRYMMPLADRLHRDFRVFAPDLPGFGLSEKPPRALAIPGLADSLVSWMDAMGLDHAGMLGNSVGAQVVVDLAARFPDRVDHLILVGPTMDVTARSLPRQLLRWVRCIPDAPASLIRTVLRDVLDCGMLRVATTLHYAMHDRPEEKLLTVQAPVLAIRGYHDVMASERWVQILADAAPHGHQLTLPGGGHAINYDSLESTASIIRRFVYGLVPGAHRQVAG